MGDMNGEPLYCPLCGTLPSARDDPRRICPSCDQSMKDIRWLDADAVAGLRRVVARVQTTPAGTLPTWARDTILGLAALIGDDGNG
jgi:hypothetical protein